ncbi:hypothetical protein HMI54_009940 [Coelomomyces lativittatus]|nr:hypothetical protein HMI56_003831 [Coelomomyces lativittatus]KAJ1501470.1 hypothetical protein HMI54_009940 [Coelomomyces lativittatus]
MAFSTRFPRLHRFSKTSLLLVQLGAFVHVFNSHIAEVTMCIGPSMLPTLNMYGDFVLVNKLAPRFRDFDLGDIVVAKSMNHPDRHICKRILGMPGDTVCLDPSDTSHSNAYVKIPEGHVWLTGDNLSNSTDSRTYGPVPIALLKGKVLARVWPDPKLFKSGITSSTLIPP